MKKKINKSKIFYWLLSIFIIGTIASCKKEDTNGTGAPVIERVRTISRTDTISGVSHPVTLDSSSVYDDSRVVLFDSTVATGQLNHQYAIIGQNLATTISVSFNGVSVYYNPALITDHSIIISIPANVPFGPSQSNKLTIVTQHGTADFDFPIQQPPPIITSFSPLAGAAGDNLTITGSVFDGVTGVRFGTTDAQIVSSTPTQIVVTIPAGVVQAFIFVTTPGGTTQSVASYGFKAIVFDDQLATGWSITSYSATTTISTMNVKRGTSSLMNYYTGGYGAFRLDYSGAEINVAAAGLTAIKLSIYGTPGTAGKRVKIGLNDTYDDSKTMLLDLTEGQYNDFTIPLSQFGNPAKITQIILQEFSGNAPSTIHIDDIGFI